jgi:heme/copper-type cytochrome/quinol oxidase subunit 2
MNMKQELSPRVAANIAATFVAAYSIPTTAATSRLIVSTKRIRQDMMMMVVCYQWKWKALPTLTGVNFFPSS